ncbi:MAG: hypothetical protein KBS74_08240 [Clostridiales bacterium]|nr:hypothetical protein [Candidatus Cacconaster stercorequi]
MECPYCKKEMEKGGIGANFWWRDNGSSDRVMWEKVPLCSIWSNGADGFYCPDCRIIILPVPEKLDSPMEKIKEKWSKLRGDVEERYNDYKSEQEAEKYQKKKEERRKKDPWEV